MAAKTDADGSSVVILGGWNPAVLTPAWLARHVFGGNAEQIPVEMELSSIAGQPPRFRMMGLRIVPAYDKLTIVAQSLSGPHLEECETRLKAILDKLPHTPITALGINFTYVDPSPSEQLRDLFVDAENLTETSGLQFETQSVGVTRAMSMEGYVLNFTRTLTQDGNVHYKFNFHYLVTDAAAASALFDGAMARNLEVSRTIVSAYDNLGEH